MDDDQCAVLGRARCRHVAPLDQGPAQRRARCCAARGQGAQVLGTLCVRTPATAAVTVAATAVGAALATTLAVTSTAVAAATATAYAATAHAASTLAAAAHATAALATATHRTTAAASRGAAHGHCRNHGGDLSRRRLCH